MHTTREFGDEYANLINHNNNKGILIRQMTEQHTIRNV